MIILTRCISAILVFDGEDDRGDDDDDCIVVVDDEEPL